MHVGAYLRSHYSRNILLPLFTAESWAFCRPPLFVYLLWSRRNISGIKMHSSGYSYRSSDSVFSNTTSTRTSLDSNENFLSVHCGPTLVNSCISFGNESLDGHRYWVVGVRLCFTSSGGCFPFSVTVNSATSKGKLYFILFLLSGWKCCSRLPAEFRGTVSSVKTNWYLLEMLFSL